MLPPPRFGVQIILHTYAFISYVVFYLHEKVNVMRMRKSELKPIAEISDILGISATGRKILNLLVRTRKKLSVSEIIKRVKKSERSVRAHLKALTKLKLIRREITITKKGKLAYRYFVSRAGDLVKSVREETLRRLRDLEKYVKWS